MTKIEPSRRNNNFMLRQKPTRNQAAIMKWFMVWRQDPQSDRGREAERELAKLGTRVWREE